MGLERMASKNRNIAFLETERNAPMTAIEQCNVVNVIRYNGIT
jgi:hypothetical protein